MSVASAEFHNLLQFFSWLEDVILALAPSSGATIFQTSECENKLEKITLLDFTLVKPSLSGK